MNIGNKSQSEVQELIAILDDIVAMGGRGSDLVEAMHASGHRVVKAVCDGCMDVHPDSINVRAFHSPCCKKQHVCHMCGSSENDWPSGHQIGAICDICYEEG